jgi:hypothetical protein
MAVGWPTKTTYANGDVYSASDVNDTNGTLNLAAGAQWAAAKNRIINGDFYVNQRNFTSTTTSSYGFDRWRYEFSSGTNTYSAQTFTPGAAPVAGYEGKNFAQMDITGQSASSAYNILGQRLEDVRTFAGQTVTLSFWAKASSGTPKIGLEITQVFGSGGSPSAFVSTPMGSITTSTSWVRYSKTIAVPSISGKTIGTDANSSFIEANLWLSAGSDHNTRASSIGINNSTFQIWGVQLEQGSTATAFQTATGTIQGELAACQRYYYRAGSADTNAYGGLSNAAFAQTTTVAISAVALPVQMRIAPTSVDFANVAFRQTNGSANGMTGITIDSGQTSATIVSIYGTTSSMTINLPGFLMKNNNSAGYLGFSAEL